MFKEQLKQYISLSDSDLSRYIHYIAEKGYIRKSNGPLFKITAAGIRYIGEEIVDNETLMIILEQLNKNYPNYVENIFFQEFLDMDDFSSRRIFSYLEDTGLVEINWFAGKRFDIKITSYGIDQLVPEKNKLAKEDTISMPNEIEMALETPFTNITKVSELMQKLKGDILLIEKHFDQKGFKFVKKLNPLFVSNVKILMSTDHLSRDFKDIFKAFKTEMDNKGITVELRILDEKDVERIHDRYILSEENCYNIPPMNIIHKKLGDIKRIQDVESKKAYFKKCWARATNIIKISTK